MTTTLLARPTPIDDATRSQSLIGAASLAALLTACPVDSVVDDLVGRVARDRLGKPLSRRLFLAGTATLGLTACGGSTTEAPQPTGSVGFPVTLVGKEGTATIPAEPRRVIAVGFQRDTDTVLALGVTPTAMVKQSSFPSDIAPWVESALTGPRPELLYATNGLPFEKIAGLRPDLILATDDYELTGNYPRLAQIAPTLSYVNGVESDTWQQRTTHIGRALGRAEQAQKLITDIEVQLTQAAQAHPVLTGKQLGLKISPDVDGLPQADTPGRASVSLRTSVCWTPTS